MNKWNFVPIVIACMLPVSARAEGPVTKNAVVSLVKDGIAYLKAKGKDALLKEINMANGQFHTGQGGRDPELYLFAYNSNGVCLAQGFTYQMVGQNRWEAKDVLTGKLYIQEFVSTANKNKNGGWVSYNFKNPKTGKFEPKASFLMKAEGEDLILGCGMYQ